MIAKETVLISTFAAITAVLGMLPPIPVSIIPVPLTAQTLGVMITGCILRPTSALFAMLLFLILLSFGLPILSGGRGGIGVFFGPSSGFLIGWPIGAFIISFLLKKTRRLFFHYIFANLIGGVFVIYFFGILFMALILDLSLFDSFTTSLIFLPGDFAKVILAAAVSSHVVRAYPDRDI